MSSYTLETVSTPLQKREFIELPKRMYREDPNWVSPLDNDIEAQFDPSRNELFNGGDAVRFLLRDNSGKTVGRIAAFYNDRQAAASEQPTGGCGFFECINDAGAAAVLFDAAREWLKDRGMEAMDGPINFGDRNDWWGVLVEGFSQPLYKNPYNFPYYKELFEAYGFKNYFNQYTYSRGMEIGKLNPAVAERAERLFATEGYKFTYATEKRLEEYADDFREVYNKAWVTFTGVNPITAEHAQKLMKNLKPIADPKLLYFAYYNNEPIGFFIMFPDINTIIGKHRGKFGLLQKARLLWDIKRGKADRIFGLIFGVIPEFQGKGVEGGLIKSFENTLMRGEAKHYKSLELAWIGDFNPVMMRIVESFVCASKFKTHVTYRYLFDREKEFTRAPRLGRGKPSA